MFVEPDLDIPGGDVTENRYLESSSQSPVPESPLLDQRLTLGLVLGVQCWWVSQDYQSWEDDCCWDHDEMWRLGETKYNWRLELVGLEKVNQWRTGNQDHHQTSAQDILTHVRGKYVNMIRWECHVSGAIMTWNLVNLCWSSVTQRLMISQDQCQEGGIREF